MNITGLEMGFKSSSSFSYPSKGADGVRQQDQGGYNGRYPAGFNDRCYEVQIKKTSPGMELTEVHYYGLYGYNPLTRGSVTEDCVSQHDGKEYSKVS
jgi:hypothetical protein